MVDYLEIGRIVNTSGLKGMLKVIAFTDDIIRFDDLKTIYIQDKEKLIEYTIEQVRYQKNLVFIKLKGIDRIEDAEKLKGLFIKINRKNLIKLPEDTYFIVDLLGLKVYTEEEVYLGVLEDIYNTGSNDIYVVKDELGKQLLLPAISEVVKVIDIKEQRIIVHLLEGLN